MPQEYAPECARKGKMAGCSAGALVAAGLMCDCCLGQATTDTLKLVIQVRTLLHNGCASRQCE